MHPLAEIGRKVVVIAKKVGVPTSGFDKNGNPVINSQKLQLELLVMTTDNQVSFRETYGAESSIGRLFVELYILRAWFDINGVKGAKIVVKTINLNELQDQLISLDNKVNFSILDRNQSNLKPITEIFGKKILALQSGVIPI